MKNTISEIKDTVDGMNSRPYEGIECKSSLEDRVIKLSR